MANKTTSKSPASTRETKKDLAFRGIFLAAFTLFAATFSVPLAKAQEVDWRSELEFLANELPKRHVNLFAKVDEETFNRKVAELSETIGKMDAATATMELMKLVAMIGDGHTTVVPDQTSFRYFRVNVRWFKSGIHVRAIDERHKDLVGAKLTAVGDVKAKSLEQKFAELFSHDNIWGVRKAIDKQFPTFEYLKFAGATNPDDTATFHFEKDGTKRSITLNAVAVKDFRKKRIVNSFHIGMMKKSVFLDLMMKDEKGFPHWNDWIAPEKTLYFKYNQCRDAKGFQKLVDGTARFVEQNPVQKFVLDLRDNSGGNSLIFKPLLKYLAGNKTLNREGKLFVLVGRDTFSSGLFAAMDMKKTNAIFIGEPTGCKPNHFGEVQTFTLPGSKLSVQYSTKSFTLASDDTDTFKPDIEITYTPKEFLTAFDPALNAVFKFEESSKK